MIWLTTVDDVKFLVNPANISRVLPAGAMRNLKKGVESRILYNSFDGEDTDYSDAKETPEEIDSLIQHGNPLLNLHWEIRKLIIAIQNWSR